MDLAHQHIVAELNRVAEDNRRMDEMERAATPLFYAALFAVAGLLFGTPAYFAGKHTAMKECPAANQGQRLIYTEQRKDGALCHYSSGWNLHGRSRVTRRAG